MISWPFALMMVRSFPYLPEPEEMEYFLYEAFNSWKRRTFTSHKWGYVAFSSYLKSILESACENDMAIPCAFFDIPRLDCEEHMVEDLDTDFDASMIPIIDRYNP